MLICSVFFSIQSVHSNTREDILFEVLMAVTRIHQQGGRAQFMWVPAYCGVSGNEKADTLAKRALRKQGVEMRLKSSKSEAKSVVRRQLLNEWQKWWDMGATGRHLYQMKKEVRESRVQGSYRREEIVITRLRLGHSGLNKTLHLIGKHGSGQCEVCQEEEETVEHAIVQCMGYNAQRMVMKERFKELGVKDF